MAQRYEMTFLETSAKSSQNVDDLFQGLAKECMKNLAIGRENSGASAVNLFRPQSQKWNFKFGGSCCR